MNEGRHTDCHSGSGNVQEGECKKSARRIESRGGECLPGRGRKGTVKQDRRGIEDNVGERGVM